jgi:RNA polymerase sigma factor (sigma-70 family)
MLCGPVLFFGGEMDESCIVSARAGDAQATEEVVSSLRPRLVRMARHYARRCTEDADELLAEAWVGMLEALARVDARIGDPEQYLIQHARWRLLDLLRRVYGRDARELISCDYLDELSAGIQEDALEAIEVAQFLAILSLKQRAVLRCLLAGLTWREAGRRLGCSSANVAYYMRQIRKIYEQWRGE